jgi:L-glyceraldehyde 3-phosphate reductase
MSYGAFEKIHTAAEDRYEKRAYQRAGNSGLDLPALSLGRWQKFGMVLRTDRAPYRDELIPSTKTGSPIGPSPYLRGGSRRSPLTSLKHSLRNLGTDYVDIFYRHHHDRTTPLEETVGALVRQPQVTSALSGVAPAGRLDDGCGAGLPAPARPAQDGTVA